SKKADIFTTPELDRLFRPESFPNEMYYLFFLLCLSGGLRLGEVRAVRVKQIVFDRKVLIVDGFCKMNGERTSNSKYQPQILMFLCKFSHELKRLVQDMEFFE
ncbi:MAG: site-specific integrase, partial [Treponema sp.]|nr:site-specific integrase [Treponema sp.]